MEKVCFMFGHATVPANIQTMIELAAEHHYLQHGVRIFVVGNRGEFDSYAASAVKSLKRRYSDIVLMLLLAYHPAEREVFLSEGFDNSYYPPLEHTPRRYAIVKANQYMVDTSNTIICYAKYAGNSKKLLEYAQSRKRDASAIVDNLGDYY